MQGSRVLGFPCHKSARISRLPIRATCPANHILLHLITITIYGLVYRRSSLHDFLGVVSVPLAYTKHLSQHTNTLSTSPSFTPISNNRKHYSSVYVSVHAL